MHILVAPNAFKNSLAADAVAEAICRGLRQSRLSCTTECFPVGDGGDGTARLIVRKCQGDWISGNVLDPLGRAMEASFGMIDEGNTAIIEMADASGIKLLSHEELDPLHATSFGTGLQVKQAMDKGARRIIIGMGGSATVDGGVGIVQALGIRFLDNSGNELQQLPASLVNLASIDLTGMDKRIPGTKITVLCDVENVLLGPQGSAAIFGPQKGASSSGVQQLDAALSNLARVTLKQTGKDMAGMRYGGTAGGAAAGLAALLNASLVNGIEYFLELTGFEQALESAGLVITGEGSIDEQTLQGKGPFGVARAAKLKGLPVVALAGKMPLEPNDLLDQYFDALLPIGHQPMELQEALAHTEANLSRTATLLGNLLAQQS